MIYDIYSTLTAEYTSVNELFLVSFNRLNKVFIDSLYEPVKVYYFNCTNSNFTYLNKGLCTPEPIIQANATSNVTTNTTNSTSQNFTDILNPINSTINNTISNTTLPVLHQ